MSDKHKANNSGVMVGLIILAIGSLILLEKMDIMYFPHWVYSWQMILIAIGLVIGAKRNFRPGGWLITVFIGTVFLAEEVDFFGVDMHRYLWPIALILIGVFCVVRSLSPRKEFNWEKYAHKWDDQKKVWEGMNSERGKGEFVDATAVMSGIKRRVFSKEFSGGDITCFFGNAEIDLSQADIVDTVLIDVTLVFGGLKLLVPANWEIQSEITAVFGGVDDKRMNTASGAGAKRLILTGVCVFGGVDIKSF